MKELAGSVSVWLGLGMRMGGGVVVDGGWGLGWGLPAMPTQTMATGGVAMVVGGSGVVFFDCWVSELWGSLVLC